MLGRETWHISCKSSWEKCYGLLSWLMQVLSSLNRFDNLGTRLVSKLKYLLISPFLFCSHCTFLYKLSNILIIIQGTCLLIVKNLFGIWGFITSSLGYHHRIVKRKNLPWYVLMLNNIALHFFLTSIPWYLCAHKFYRLSSQIHVWNWWIPIFPGPNRNLINWPCLIYFKFEIQVWNLNLTFDMFVNKSCK